MIVDIIDINIQSTKFKDMTDNARKIRGKSLFEERDVTLQKVELLDEKSKVSTRTQIIMQEIEEDSLYRIEAKVAGNTKSYYHTSLIVTETRVLEYACDCMDYGPLHPCKHIYATFLESKFPHNATTSDGMLRLMEKRRRENILREKEEKEKAIKEVQRLEELRKLREEREEKKKQEKLYLEKYGDAVAFLDYYKIHHKISDRKLIGIDPKEIYEEYLTGTKKENTSHMIKTDISIEPRIEMKENASLLLFFKLGNGIMYVLKDILSFYEAFQKEELLYFGKKLSFYAKKESFKEKDRKILDYILEYGRLLKKEKEMNSYYDIQESDISINSENMNEIFSLLKDRKFIFKYPIPTGRYSFQSTEEEYFMTEEKYPFSFLLKKREDNYFITYDDSFKLFLPSTDTIYFFNNGKVYANKVEDVAVFSRLLSLLLQKGEVVIPEDRLEEYVSYIFPKLKDGLRYEIQGELEENNNISESLIVYPLASKVFLDLDKNNNIILTLKFCYGDLEYNILDKNYQKELRNKKIYRNFEEEKVVLTRLFQDGFTMKNGKNYFIMEDEEKSFVFLTEKIMSYMNDFEVLATENFKNKEVRRPQISTVGVRVNNGLLELDLSKVDFDMNEIKKVLQSYALKKKYYKLKSGDFLDLSKNQNLDFLEDVFTNLDVDYQSLNKGIAKLSINRGVYLEKLLSNNNEMSVSVDDNFTQMISKINNKEYSDNSKIPQQMENILREYQKVGYSWLKGLENYHFGGILADDMGLRKNPANYYAVCFLSKAGK